MNTFEQELKNDNLICSHCPRCDKIVWPPSEFCNLCFCRAEWRSIPREARLVEFSKKDGEYFCIAEFGAGFRVMGSLELRSGLKVGDSLILARCDYDGTEKFFFVPNC